MSKSTPNLKISFFYRGSNKAATREIGRIKDYIQKKYPGIVFDKKSPDALFVLGGDGTILEAARKYHHRSNPMIFGLNLGTVGFLASVRDPQNFKKGIDVFFKNKYSLSERVILNAEVWRKSKKVFSSEALNDVIVQNILGMVDLDVMLGDTNIRRIRGSGALVSTATGSTAFNLSAHGPIVAPDIRCLVITEIMDHNIPTPSIVVKHSEEILIKVVSFRKKGVFSIEKNKNKTDVVFVCDGNVIFPLEEGDIVKIKSSDHFAKFVEIEPNYFFKSLKDKFSVR